MEFFKNPITGEEYVKGEIRANDIITTTKVDYLGLIVGVKEIDDKRSELTMANVHSLNQFVSLSTKFVVDTNSVIVNKCGVGDIVILEKLEIKKRCEESILNYDAPFTVVSYNRYNRKMSTSDKVKKPLYDSYTKIRKKFKKALKGEKITPYKIINKPTMFIDPSAKDYYDIYKSNEKFIHDFVIHLYLYKKYPEGTPIDDMFKEMERNDMINILTISYIINEYIDRSSYYCSKIDYIHLIGFITQVIKNELSYIIKSDEEYRREFISAKISDLVDIFKKLNLFIW